MAALFFFLAPTLVFSQNNRDQWKTEISIDDGSFLLTTFLDVVKDKNEATLTSPKNADARVVGWTKARTGRLFGKSPKKGILLTINAIQKGDSLVGSALLPALGKTQFKGNLTESALSGELIMNDTLVVGTISGRPTRENYLNFRYLYQSIIDTVQANIYSKEVLQTKEWLKFKKSFKKLCDKATDDLELLIGFSMMSSNLPFSHLFLMMQEDEIEEDSDELTNEKTVFFEEKGNNTAYLRVENFSSSEGELSEILPKIVNNKAYQNLIIDLRNNGGGGIEAANEFGRHIINESLDIGYFVTNKLDYDGFDAALFETLPEAKPQTTEEFITDLKSGRGAKLVFNKSEVPVFSGKIYILTNENTASTCEPIVYLLKEKKKATIIIGENTAGAMLSAALFEIEGKYKLYLPLADFYTYDGMRLDQTGVKPDIETSSDDALIKALEIIEADTAH